MNLINNKHSIPFTSENDELTREFLERWGENGKSYKKLLLKVLKDELDNNLTENDCFKLLIENCSFNL